MRPLPAELPREKKLIPIVADDQIDPKFGTGVLKVTPAHDRADWEIHQRLCERAFKDSKADLVLEILTPIEVINADGKMNDLAGIDLSGLDRFEARKVAVEKLKALSALVKEEPYENNVGFSQRARVPIEPRLSEQWFMRYPSLEKSRTCVATGEMKFHPDRWAKDYDHWMGRLQDWCISRQLWWGHRIPIWTKSFREDQLPSEVREAILRRPDQLACLSGKPGEWTHCGMAGQFPTEFTVTAATISTNEAAELERLGFSQDPDVLDTWFSSWLWPFATMGWPESTATLRAFYPTTDLVTGPDIIFFWVARMIMAGYEYLGEMPFRNVYFTGIIRDKKGQKMSKTLGNSPDPLDLISRYGADALRFGTMRSAPLGQDVLFDEKDVELGRNFCNKLWNACRFREMQGGPIEGDIEPARLTSDDKWILLKLDRAIREIDQAFAEYRFNEVSQTLYRFFWSEYCDWYIEASKAVLHGSDAAQKANTIAVIDFVLSHALRLFHPFLPFITEELWHGLGYGDDLPQGQGGETILFAPWPKPLDGDFHEHYGLDESDERFVNAKYEFVTLGRNLRREGNLSSAKKVRFVLKPAQPLSAYEEAVLKILLNAEPLEFVSESQAERTTPTVHSVLGELYLPLEGLIDAAAEKARREKELARIDSEIEKVLQKLNNPAFVEKVPPAVLQEHQKRLADWQAKRQHLDISLSD